MGVRGDPQLAEGGGASRQGRVARWPMHLVAPVMHKWLWVLVRTWVKVNRTEGVAERFRVPGWVVDMRPWWLAVVDGRRRQVAVGGNCLVGVERLQDSDVWERLYSHSTRRRARRRPVRARGRPGRARGRPGRARKRPGRGAVGPGRSPHRQGGSVGLVQGQREV